VGAAQGLKSCPVEHVGMVVFGLRDSSHGRWPDHRNETRRFVLHRTGTRQLGGRR
jgi:hypothetical protein